MRDSEIKFLHCCWQFCFNFETHHQRTLHRFVWFKENPPTQFPHIKPPFDNKIGPDIYNVFIWDMYNMEYVMIAALCIFAVLINVSMNCLLMEISTNFATILVKNMINRNYLSGYYLGLASTEKLPCGTVINNSNQSLQ